MLFRRPFVRAIPENLPERDGIDLAGAPSPPTSPVCWSDIWNAGHSVGSLTDRFD
jgi:hypothetical protein